MVKYLPPYNSPIFDLVQLSQNPWRVKQANIFLLSKTGNNLTIPFAIPGKKNPVQSNTHKNKLHRTDTQSNQTIPAHPHRSKPVLLT